MRLAAIELENFKGIADRQRIELRPITLLFGPNSAGKSTIIQALHYIREVLARRNVDPDVTVAGGLLNLGGFASLVHRHELDRSVGLKLELDVSAVEVVSDLPLNTGAYVDESDFSDLQVRYLAGEGAEVHTVGVELKVCWSQQEAAAFVSRIGIELNGLPLVAITSPAERGRAQLTEFNFLHPLFQLVEAEAGVRASSPLEDLLWLVSRQSAIDRSRPATPQSELRVGIATALGALPDINEGLWYIDVRDPEANEEELERTPRVQTLCRFLSEIVIGPLRIVRRCLEDMTYVGPLRQVPSRGYRPQVSPDESRWAHGLAAWDLLHTLGENELVENTSRWLSDPLKLNTGYQLERLEFRRVPIPGPFAAFFQRGLEEDDIFDLQALFEQLVQEREIAIRELRTELLVAPSDIGVGLSQLVPVIVAILRQKKNLVAIEQPELHVHPAIQVGLGDLLISGIRSADEEMPSDRTLLVETHSEHIMLRLLRRIRETTENELPPGAAALHPDEVAVIYVELPRPDDLAAGANSVKFTSIRISDEGEFVDRWPKGFFEERVEEVF
jgi:predicted ATPase